MVVGVLRITFHIPHARSLKDKRAVVRHFRDRVRARHSVSVAEVGAHDVIQTAIFGVAAVGPDGASCERALADVRRAAEVAADAQLLRCESEIVSFGDELYGGDA